MLAACDQIRVGSVLMLPEDRRAMVCAQRSMHYQGPSHSAICMYNHFFSSLYHLWGVLG